MTKCKLCEHAIFDETWGEYKCKVKQRRVPQTEKTMRCKDFKRKKENKT